ncbi:TPA: hypothetical protein ACPZFU_000951 [Yersinia enterocolitica]|uniref:Addiction module toxin RelE n=2 Tax=Yersinia enterocolitica TaxID=630 RepID=A0ABP1Y307_YEREN|nr:hypothetical protein [Yersinia enterocolitica]CBX73315.1 unknown protein [Yersinia enterocolitica W22703]AJJ25877.1 hypothetical protein CH48_503 [Yersinia enterocolitica]KGA63021.1 hypothetical protein DJ61_673 [Yersinia enterocolitica]MDA5486258.1 hypothetical protein [Yersinia enterocolitica]CFV25833.1 Uncharacterised protein [Yersinia enterocolitica]
MKYPIAFNLQHGGQGVHPDELTLVSDSGKRVQPTQQQVER